MKHIKVFETTSALNTWKAAHSGVNPYAYFCIDSGTTYYRDFINNGTHAYVDLGLPSETVWATMNLGASSITDVGDLFAWGEIDSQQVSDTTIWIDYNEDIIYKYNEEDGKFDLDPNDDAAIQNWGCGWIMPTSDHFYELLDYCEISVTMNNGVKCCVFTSSINNNTLTFPLIEHHDSHDYDMACYWSSKLSPYSYYNACGLYLYPGDTLYFVENSWGRANAGPIRPVIINRNFEQEEPQVQEK